MVEAVRQEVNGMLVVDGLLRRHGLVAPDEVWVHGMWTPDKWLACVRAKLSGKRLVRMTHGGLSPVCLRRQRKWLKRLVKPLERILFAWADRVVLTGEWEVEWARAWGLKRPLEVIDLKRFFDLKVPTRPKPGAALHVLYLGRVHPMKGTDALQAAVAALGESCVVLRMVSDHFGAALEADWSWADVLVLPTLSENFGLVVAEALQRGIPAITTDGAPAWEGQSGVIYLRGYREGTFEQRVELLRKSLEEFGRLEVWTSGGRS